MDSRAKLKPTPSREINRECRGAFSQIQSVRHLLPRLRPERMLLYFFTKYERGTARMAGDSCRKVPLESGFAYGRGATAVRNGTYFVVRRYLVGLYEFKFIQSVAHANKLPSEKQSVHYSFSPDEE